MKQTEILIEEEHIRFFWGLFIVVCVGGASYLLANAFFVHHGSLVGVRQIFSLLLLAIGAYGIIKISTPLYHFILKVDDAVLQIEIWQGKDSLLQSRQIALDDIKALRIRSHTPRSYREALFDFSSNFHLLYKDQSSEAFKPLIGLNEKQFMLKVEDIRKIIRFLKSHHADLAVPDPDSLFITTN